MDENGQIPASIQSAAKQLYGALHQRFIQTPSGLVEMQKKYTAKVYGCCPRVLCQGQALLPVGLSDKFSMDTVKLYCMRCEDIYVPKSTAHSQIDGAYFGTSLPQLFILSQQIRLAPYQDRIVKYVPKVFGFRIADPEVVARIDAKETHTMH